MKTATVGHEEMVSVSKQQLKNIDVFFTLNSLVIIKGTM